ncbi:DUF309 domain-containing protein [Paenibacillus sp. YYML68]|uniref:DUF309 domain-containing protein n=1 Tax=Paenibacillus sp. YYML68 TaxID=2909250 RepID=UPI0024925D7B|nr:DUF309 domain-containing protein [Paenibacillus sp. YYML68]
MVLYPEALIRYYRYFHIDRDYFECHEVLEEYWKEHPDDPNKEAYVTLIQVAVASYHERRGNKAGAVKMFRSALSRLQTANLGPLGLDTEALKQLLESRLEGLTSIGIQAATEAFQDLNLPLVDDALLRQCQLHLDDIARWGRSSDHSDSYLLNKHTLRDRSEVIEERQRQQQIRQSGRG